MLFNPLVTLPGLLLALVLHEYAHARTADALGDPTPRNMGRLTLNPIPHIDPIGLLMLFIFRFGWAKPVPVNPYYFKDARRGMLLVAAAGPATNIVLAFIIRLAMGLLPWQWMIGGYLPQALQYAYLINLYLAVFNLLPVPPLDGSRILAGLVPAETAEFIDSLETYGWLILVILLWTGITSRLLLPVVGWLDALLRNLTGVLLAVTGLG
ncbi:MAG TPA: site-2 protease family protein [Sphingobacteriaceae bacterium]|nr:site-2 protease family protein [Sphingobacteriaceae bacterium]